MSSLIILKKIERYVPEKAIEAIERSAAKANMYCILIKLKYDGQLFLSGEGTLSEVDESKFKSLQNKENLKYFIFNVHPIEEDSFDSFTWLTHDENYLWALDIENIQYEDYEFIYKFVIEYFKDNPEDYLWFDDAEWYYTADDILRLSQKPYNPKWCSEKVI
ncbi:hypothetical protein AB4Z30_26515 [Paenibacillus sp. 2TAF8]|uniref:hypothetical protein n=1 Tax=Paenibacillus sp. 2TAF8 TaxID=3233020 RepID=UPI003F9C310A